jgi:mercuric ion transport protein
MDTRNDNTPRATARASLLAGGLATLLASTCCLGPLVLVLLGFSGAWIGQLTALEPYRPVFVTAALLALAMAWRQIWKPPVACAPAQVCARPGVRRAYKVLFWLIATLLAIALVSPYLAPWFY